MTKIPKDQDDALSKHANLHNHIKDLHEKAKTKWTLENIQKSVHNVLLMMLVDSVRDLTVKVQDLTAKIESDKRIEVAVADAISNAMRDVYR